MSFCKEALKRYLLLSLIESEAMANNDKIMEQISSNALKAAETMRNIDNMFGFGKKKDEVMEPQYPPQNPYNNSYPPVQQQPLVNPIQQQPVQPQQYPAYDINRDMQERQARIAAYQAVVQNLYAQINNLQAQVFDNVQKIHAQVAEISKTIYS